jgi:hypothetical protein
MLSKIGCLLSPDTKGEAPFTHTASRCCGQSGVGNPCRPASETTALPMEAVMSRNLRSRRGVVWFWAALAYTVALGWAMMYDLR